MTHLDVVRSFVADGAFGPDQRLPPERELVSILGLTRNQIRSAFKKLESEGLIWRHVGKGTFLGQRPPDASTTAAGQAPVKTDLTNPREVIEARMVIEPAIVRLAASRATVNEIEDMEKALQRLREARSPEEFQTLDREWHAILADAADNAMLASFLEIAHVQTDPNIWGRLRSLYMSSGRMAEAVTEHAEILEAIRTRNPMQAEELMRGHIRSVRHHIFGDPD